MKMKLDLAYVAAKSFGIRGMLIPHSTLEELAESKSLEDFVDRIRPTLYGPHLAEVPRPYTPLGLETAFRRHLIDIHYRQMNDAPRPEIIEAYFYRYTASNLKAILKAKALNKPYEELLTSLDFYAEALTRVRDEVVRAAAAKDLAEALKELKPTFLSAEADLAVKVWEQKRDLTAFDAVIDKSYYSKLLAAYGKAPRSDRSDVRPMVALDVDSYTVMTILRSKLWELTSAETREFMPDTVFDIDEKSLERLLAATNVAQALKELEATAYGKYVPREAGDQVGLLRMLERAFEDGKYSLARRAYTQKISSLAVVLAAVFLKSLEVKNLTVIATGLAEGLSSTSIAQKLVKAQ